MARSPNGRAQPENTALPMVLGSESIAGVTLSDVSAVFDAGISIERWSEILTLFGRIGKAAEWWLGDALNFGEAKFSHRYAQYAELTGYANQTLMNYAYVARAVEVSRRRETLPFGHHAEVAALPAPLADRILDRADGESREDGQMLPRAAVRQLVREAQRQAAADAAPPMPDGAYGLIYADPPWQHDAGTTDPTRTIELQQYGTMSIDQIAAMALPAVAADAVLALWATAPLLPEALSVMAAWGFAYKTNMTWDKERIGMGYWVRGRHEHLLIGTAGNPSPPPEQVRPESVIRSVCGAHSQKPPVVYELLEAMFPSMSKIELFARTTRPGWDVWGSGVKSIGG